MILLGKIVYIFVESDKNFVEVLYDSPITNENIILKIQRDLIEKASHHPVAFTTVCEGASITLYIDKNFQVRGVEHSIFLENYSEGGKNPGKNEVIDSEDANLENFGKVLVLGLSKVGKTSIINRLSNNYFASTKPTLGVNIMKAVLEQTRFIFYDVGGQKMLRKQWTSTVNNPDAIVFVFDVNCGPELLNETIYEFKRVIQHYSIYAEQSIPILILGNKIDIMAAKKISKQSIMDVLIQLFEPEQYNINYRVGLVSALSGEGINYNFKWLIAKNIMI